MAIISSPGRWDASRGSCVTIGNFDGLHRGHISLLSLTAKLANSSGTAFLPVTFWPHAKDVLHPGQPRLHLTTREEKLALLEALHPAHILEIPFTEDLARLTPEEFVSTWLMPLNPRHIVIGHDFHFGHERKGALSTLTNIGDKAGFSVTQAPAMLQDGAPISSSRIRREIQAGHMEAASHLLGRPYSIEGVVERGFGRGTGLGFPTANLPVPAKLLPPAGVYATRVIHAGKAHAAVTNIGANPTFNGQRVTVESFLPDVTLDLYDQKIRVDFLKRLRPEIKFASAEELRAQIASDIANARKIFTTNA